MRRVQPSRAGRSGGESHGRRVPGPRSRPLLARVPRGPLSRPRAPAGGRAGGPARALRRLRAGAPRRGAGHARRLAELLLLGRRGPERLPQGAALAPARPPGLRRRHPRLRRADGGADGGSRPCWARWPAGSRRWSRPAAPSAGSTTRCVASRACRSRSGRGGAECRDGAARRHRRHRAGRPPGRRLPARGGLRRPGHAHRRRARPAVPAPAALQGLPAGQDGRGGPAAALGGVLRQERDRPPGRRAGRGDRPGDAAGAAELGSGDRLRPPRAGDRRAQPAAAGAGGGPRRRPLPAHARRGT